MVFLFSFFYCYNLFYIFFSLRFLYISQFRFSPFIYNSFRCYCRGNIFQVFMIFVFKFDNLYVYWSCIVFTYGIYIIISSSIYITIAQTYKMLTSIVFECWCKSKENVLYYELNFLYIINIDIA